MLALIRADMTYREMSQVMGIHRDTAKRRADTARQHFAEMHQLPVETLNLDEPRQRKPRLSDEERRLLDDYFIEKFGGSRESRLDFPESPQQFGGPEASTSHEPDTLRGWVQDVEQSRQNPPKRQR